ncbi:MAG: ketopantoate reductase [Arcobacter sp.]|nr:MAG: ketopantoate reductase [Arcobacter sp.]
MNFIILGAGGVGSFYGARLIFSGHNVTFVARGEHLRTLQQNGLKLLHPKFSFDKKVKALALNNLSSKLLHDIDAVIITTKSTSTLSIAKELLEILKSSESIPYIISLQNGVENEKILCEFFDRKSVIGGLTRKIGAHIIEPGVIEVTGNVETIIGAIEKDEKNRAFLDKFTEIIQECDIKCEVVDDINFELWKKLIINNGVNAICALLRIKTGELMSHEKLSKIVFGLMNETAIAAKVDKVFFSSDDVSQMYELIKNFDSIKPSMLVDVEHNREIELDEICNIVIENCQLQDIDAPYTRTISTLLEFTYIENKNKV